MTQQFKKVGEYRFIRRIGKGATSQVFEAKKQSQSERYAIKMIKHKGLNPDQKQIINKEISIIKNINHPNIVHLYETFQTTNNMYLVFEFCQRGDIEKYLNQYYGPRLPEQTAQRIIYCIADAVALIHSKGITHRDLKLANVLLKKDYQIKLADFGFAKEESKKMYMQTYCGTPITMAPEIMQNKPYDKKVDVWSLGVITFQLIYGRLPFATSDGLTKFMEYVISQPLEIPSQPPMSVEFKQLLLMALQKNPQKRCDIKKFMMNKWVEQGSQNTIPGSINKKPSIQQLLQKVSQESKHDQIHLRATSQIQVLVSQRVNKLIVQQLSKIMNKHQKLRNDLVKRTNPECQMRNLLYKLDYRFINFMRNLQIKVGKENSSQIIKANQLIGMQFTKTLVAVTPISEPAGNVIYTYLHKTVNQKLTNEQKLQIYKLAYDTLEILQIFQLRVVVLFANHLFEEFQIGNVIERIRNKQIYQEISEQVQFTKGNHITLAMESQDHDQKVKNLRHNLQRSIQKRIQDIIKDINGY